MKKILSLLLACICAVSTIYVSASVDTYAASKTAMVTLVKGEKISFYPDPYGSNVKSVTSSKKSVVSAKKNPDESYQIVVTAKEKGTATVTAKTENGTKKFNFKVVGNAIKIKAIAQVDGYLIYEIKNDTSVTYSSFAFDWTAKDSDGDVLKTGTEYISKLAAKSTAYTAVYVGYSSIPSLKKSTAKANFENSRHYLDYKYTNCTEKVKVTVTESFDDYAINFKVKVKNSVNDYVDFGADLVLYDCDDNIVDIINFSDCLGKKETTTKEGISYAGEEYDHYEIFIRAYTGTAQKI